MNPVRSVSVAAIVVAAMASLVPIAALGQTPSNFVTVASKLNGPRGLRFGPDGALYVAEAGTGGTNSTEGICPQVPDLLLDPTQAARRRESHASTAKVMLRR